MSSERNVFFSMDCMIFIINRFKSSCPTFTMSNTHRMRYKNEGVDSKELRRRREEEGIQLRKQKRDIQLFKRRNINETIQNDEADVSVNYSIV